MLLEQLQLLTGVSCQSIKLYLDMGLIHDLSEEHIVQKIQLIQSLRELNYSLESINHILNNKVVKDYENK